MKKLFRRLFCRKKPQLLAAATVNRDDPLTDPLSPLSPFNQVSDYGAYGTFGMLYPVQPACQAFHSDSSISPDSSHFESSPDSSHFESSSDSSFSSCD